MNTRRSGREFLGDVGRGMLVASVGLGTASDMGLGPARAADDAGGPITFGGLEPLVGLMQETPVNKLLPLLTEKLQSGTDLRRLVAAAALANARTFGGEDYVGFHTMMALAPALHMSRELPEKSRPLPVFKVLFTSASMSSGQSVRKSMSSHEMPCEAADSHAVTASCTIAP